MPGTSPSTSLYTLGKGKLYMAAWSGTTPPVSLPAVGNCPSLEVEVTEEKLDHFSSQAGTRTKDKSVVLETGYTVNFDLDEISITNLKVYLKATLVGSNVLRANTALDKEYALRFVSDNAAGENQVWEFHRCKISPNGAFSLISDEWSTLSFTAEGLSDVANNPNSPYFEVTVATTTTTSTTTTTTTT